MEKKRNERVEGKTKRNKNCIYKSIEHISVYNLCQESIYNTFDNIIQTYKIQSNCPHVTHCNDVNLKAFRFVYFLFRFNFLPFFNEKTKKSLYFKLNFKFKAFFIEHVNLFPHFFRFIYFQIQRHAVVLHNFVMLKLSH